MDTSAAAYNHLRWQGSAPSYTKKENQNEDIATYRRTLARCADSRLQHVPGRPCARTSRTAGTSWTNRPNRRYGTHRGIEAGRATRETRDKWARPEIPAKRDRQETGAGPETQVKLDAPATQAKRGEPATRVCKGKPHRVRQDSIAIPTVILEGRVANGTKTILSDSCC